MARKHDQYDDQHGLKPDVKNKINKGVRANARQEKVDNSKSKTSNESGNGGQR